jgi:hypothetical protein
MTAAGRGKDNMEEGKQLAIAFLSEHGFDVKPIPEGKDKTADLHVSDGESNFLIEVKDKWEGEEVAEDRRDQLGRGEIYYQDDPLSYSNRISGVLREAQKQLDRTPKCEGTFQLVWFHATGVDADLIYRQAFATFYGIMDLIPLSPRDRNSTDTCFYFRHNEAFNMPDVEALILTDKGQLQVCLNEFSARNKEFRQTQLCRKLFDLGGVIDPVALASRGEIIAFKTRISRKNEQEIIKALQEQTGTLYTSIILNRHAASAAVMPGRTTRRRSAIE